MRFTCQSGRAIGYAIEGEGDTLVLLHPVGLDRQFWADVIDQLTPRFRTIAVDLPGHGESDTITAPLSLGEVAGDVADLISEVGQPPLTVAGCSLGGMVAQSLVLEYPVLVSGLVLANTSHTRDAKSRQTLLARADKARKDMPAIITDTIDRWFDAAAVQANPAKIEELRAKLKSADPEVHAWMWQAIADLDHAGRLDRVAVPTLVVSGSKDRSVPLSASVALAEAVPGARHFEMQGAGHLAPFEQPQVFAGLVSEFMSRAEPNEHKREDDH